MSASYSLRPTFNDARGLWPSLDGKPLVFLGRNAEVRYRFDVEIFIPSVGVFVPRCADFDEVFEEVQP